MWFRAGSCSPIRYQKPKRPGGEKDAIPQYGNTHDISLRHLIVEKGLKDKAKGGNVEFFQAPLADMLTMFAQNQIDAALVPEPWLLLKRITPKKIRLR